MADQSKSDDKLKRGDVWQVDFGDGDPVPALIVSCDEFNHLEATTVIVLPVVTESLGLPSRVRLNGHGCDLQGFAACELIRSVSRSRLCGPHSMVSHDTMGACERAMTRLIGLKPMPQRRGWGC